MPKDTENDKEVIWHPATLKDEIAKQWPKDMARAGGFQLKRVQKGYAPNNFRPMADVATGILEIKLQDDDKCQYRIIYTTKFKEAIYVLHLIAKKKH